MSKEDLPGSSGRPATFRRGLQLFALVLALLVSGAAGWGTRAALNGDSAWGELFWIGTTEVGLCVKGNKAPEGPNFIFSGNPEFDIVQDSSRPHWCPGQHFVYDAQRRVDMKVTYTTADEVIENAHVSFVYSLPVIMDGRQKRAVVSMWLRNRTQEGFEASVFGPIVNDAVKSALSHYSSRTLKMTLGEVYPDIRDHILVEMRRALGVSGFNLSVGYLSLQGGGWDSLELKEGRHI